MFPHSAIAILKSSSKYSHQSQTNQTQTTFPFPQVVLVMAVFFMAVCSYCQLPQLLAAVVLTVAACAFIKNTTTGQRQQTNGNKTNNSKQVPWAAETSTWVTSKTMSSSQAPWFLVDQAKHVTGSKVFRLRLPSAMYVVGEADLALQILKDPTSEKAGYVVGKPSKWTGSLSLFNSLNTQVHSKIVRKGTAPAFSAREVHRMDRVCNTLCKEWIQQTLEPLVKTGDTFDPSIEMTRLTFRIICEAALEYTPKDNAEIDAFLSNVEVCLREFHVHQRHNPIRRQFEFLFPGARQAHASARHLQAFARHALDLYRQKNASSERTDNNSGSRSKTVIRLLVENDKLTDRERIGEMVMFFVVGFETTGYSLSSAIVTLAQHPHVSQTLHSKLVQAETEASCLKEPPIAPEQAWKQCDYLHMVIRESLRYFPAVALGSSRHLGHDISFTDRETGQTKVLPKGAAVMMPQLLLHHNENVFTRPDQFDPDRWANATPEMNRSLLTFAAGGRGCIGQSLAKAEIESILSHLFRTYEFQIESPGFTDYFVTMKMRGYKLSVKRCPISH